MKDILLEMIPPQRQSEVKANRKKKTKQHNYEDDDTNISREKEKEIEEMNIIDIDEVVDLYTDDDKEKQKIGFKANKKKVLAKMKSKKKAFDSSNQDMQMSISSQTIQPNHETK